MFTKKSIIVTFCCLMLVVAGCKSASPTPQKPNNVNTSQPRASATDVLKSSHFLKVTKSDYGNNEVRIQAQQIPESALLSNTDETILDIDNLDGIVNYATATHHDKNISRVSVLVANNQIMNVPVGPIYFADTNKTSTNQVTQAASNISVPPPGVRTDKNIQPLATISASHDEKVRALRKIGESKLGTTYVWGHNEDRGQSGFDCSNYVEYVYHHALGYLFTTSSRAQYASVGVKVPVSQMQSGDLICFRQGAHVGIYMGNGQMIQMGGGKGKCTYLPLKPGSYWYKEVSAVKRMF